jgi:ketosteroid isomerase-like protein
MADSANAAFVRRTYELVSSGRLEELAAGFEEGFEWHPDELAPAQETRRTADQAAEAVRDFTGAFADFRTEVDELIEEGDHVIAVVRHVGRVGSGDVERREAHLWTFADGRPRSLREFEDVEGALEAAREIGRASRRSPP